MSKVRESHHGWVWKVLKGSSAFHPVHVCVHHTSPLTALSLSGSQLSFRLVVPRKELVAEEPDSWEKTWNMFSNKNDEVWFYNPALASPLSSWNDGPVQGCPRAGLAGNPSGLPSLSDSLACSLPSSIHLSPLMGFLKGFWRYHLVHVRLAKTTNREVGVVTHSIWSLFLRPGVSCTRAM